jgi:hypothetical protein
MGLVLLNSFTADGAHIVDLVPFADDRSFRQRRRAVDPRRERVCLISPLYSVGTVSSWPM